MKPMVERLGSLAFDVGCHYSFMLLIGRMPKAVHNSLAGLFGSTNVVSDMKLCSEYGWHKK